MKSDRRQPRVALRRRRQLGIALLVVLLLMVLLEVVIGDLAIYGWLSLKGAHNGSRDLEQVAALDGAVRLFEMALADQDFRDRFLPDVLAKGVSGLVLGQTTVTATLEDEGAKWNVNLLEESDVRLAQTAHEELLALFSAAGADRGLAEGISRFFADAAREEENHPRAAAHVLSVLGELRLVDGVTDEVLWGASGLAGGGAASSGAAAYGPTPGEPGSSGLSRYVTCWGEETVNVNTASREVLAAVVGTVRPELVDRIIAQRSRLPIASVTDIDGFAQLSDLQRQRLSERLATTSDTYQLTISCRTADLVTVSQVVLAGDPASGVRALLCRRLH